MSINAKRTIVGAALAILVGGGLASPSNAVPLDDISGPVVFKFIGGSTSQNTFTDGGACPVGGGCENTWIGASLTQILYNQPGSPTAFNQGEGGDFLGAIVYGVSDISITGAPPNVNIYSAGATAAGTGGVGDGNIYVDIYLRNSLVDLSAGADGRTGYNQYTGISDGASLWLRLQLVPGISDDDLSTVGVDESLATLTQTATSATNPATGAGSFYGNVVGGSAAAQFDTNGFLTGAGTFADMFGLFDFRPAFVGDNIIPGCATVPSTDCWENEVNDPIRALAVPEPASLGITGMALLLMAAAHRRRNR